MEDGEVKKVSSFPENPRSVILSESISKRLIDKVIYMGKLYRTVRKGRQSDLLSFLLYSHLETRRNQFQNERDTGEDGSLLNEVYD